MKDNNNPRFTETGAKDHDPQQKAEQIKSTDNVNTSDQQKNTPDHPHPGNAPTGKHGGGSDNN